jgi:hypothetical protein
MNHIIGLTRRSRPPAALTVAAIIATSALVLVAAACGSSPTSTGSRGGSNAGGTRSSRSASSPSAIGFSHCMRSHGIVNFPDPTNGGEVPKFSLQQLGVSGTQFQVAERACQDLLPPGANDMFPPGEVQQLLVGMLIFSQCMRSHGVPDWPDPVTGSEGRPVFLLSAHGFSRQQANSPGITRTERECQHLLPTALGGIPLG